VPLRDKNLSRAGAGAARGPGKLPAVGRWDGQAVEAIGVGDADRLLRALGVHDEQLEVLEAELVRGEDEILPGRGLVGRPAHRAEVGDSPYVRAIGLHRVDVGNEALPVEAAPDDTPAVVGKERPAVVAWRMREPPRLRAVRAHDVDLGEVAC